jgi:hypothetical protein
MTIPQSGHGVREYSICYISTEGFEGRMRVKPIIPASCYIVEEVSDTWDPIETHRINVLLLLLL